jgi:hypothetical protein
MWPMGLLFTSRRNPGPPSMIGIALWQHPENCNIFQSYLMKFHIKLMLPTYSSSRKVIHICCICSYSAKTPTASRPAILTQSTVSFTGSFPQISSSLQRSSLPIQPSFGPHAVWYVSYQLLSRSWHYGSYLLPNLEIRLTAGVNGRQGMLTPPWHLIPPLIYSEVCVCPFSDLYIL